MVQNIRNRAQLKRYQTLITDEAARKYSLWALYFNVTCNAINTKMLNPNFAIMAIPGAHPDSFDDTEPFDFNSATYFMPLCSLMGVAIASIFTGQISDKVGRKKVMLVCSWISGIGSIGMYLARETFWGFCGASFAAGLFRGTLPVAMAYVGDIFTTKKEKSDYLGVVVGCFVMGNSGGGILAILMGETGLFAPLLLGTGLIWLSACLMTWYLIEPGDAILEPVGKDFLRNKLAEFEEEKRPETINKKTFWNIILGALADNVGSTALFPLCLSPLALEAYLVDFVEANEDPIMSVTGYQWLSVCVALMVIPGTMITPWVFSKIGPSGGCVVGNVCTGILTIILLVIGNAPATTLGFAFFVAVMYLGFPLTVISQLSTGPMLDIIAPEDKIGYCQGMNNTVMNLGMAVAPWVFGILADQLGTNPAIWIGIGVSFLAGLINAPLMCVEGLGPEVEKEPLSKRATHLVDAEVVEQIVKGEYVDPEIIAKINRERIKSGLPTLTPKVTSYKEDKKKIDEIRSQALRTFEFRKEADTEILALLANHENREEELPDLCEKINLALQTDSDTTNEAYQEIGKWFADYIRDNGYHAQTHPSEVKQMIVTAFPTIFEGEEVTPENLEQALINERRVANHYLDTKEGGKYSLNKLLTKQGGAPVTFYS